LNIVEGFENWSEIDLLAGLIIGEARGESNAGKIGVALTAKTRADHPRWWGRNWREVILCRYQFSCWLDRNKSVIIDACQRKGNLWIDALRIAEDVYSGNTIDFVGRPTHYHSIAIFPDWACGMMRLATIGGHVFYRDISEIP
jgi:spore germination cell wall hydrolase CwlJ-like protein